jgi:hypothetical protein
MGSISNEITEFFFVPVYLILSAALRPWGLIQPKTERGMRNLPGLIRLTTSAP